MVDDSHFFGAHLENNGKIKAYEDCISNIKFFL